MTEGFLAEKANLLRDLRESRDELIAMLPSLTPAQMGKARRGGWTVGRVLQHVIESERNYARLSAHLMGTGTPAFHNVVGIDDTMDGFMAALEESRRELLKAVAGADEESFYRLQQIGREEYSVTSLLENVAGHDREHLGQIQGIVQGTK